MTTRHHPGYQRRRQMRLDAQAFVHLVRLDRKASALERLPVFPGLPLSLTGSTPPAAIAAAVAADLAYAANAAAAADAADAADALEALDAAHLKRMRALQ